MMSTNLSCPCCGVELPARLVGEIIAGSTYCPSQSDRARRISASLLDAALTRPSQRALLTDDELAAKRLVAYAMLGASLQPKLHKMREEA